MRVAVITSSYPQSSDDPSGHFIRTEVEALVQQGHRVTVLCPGVATPACPNANPKVVHLGATPLFGWPGALSRLSANPFVLWHLLPFVLKASHHLRAVGFDRVIAHWLVPCGFPIAITGHTPTEVVVHGSDARLLGRLPAWLRDLVLVSLERRGDTLRFVAAHLKALLVTPRTASWITSSRVSPCMVSIPALPSRSELRRLLGLPPESFVATVMGRLIPNKRVEVALNCTELPPGARVYVIGEGPCLERLRQAFGHATFLGQLPRVNALMWLKASDVLLNASRLEGAPTVVREARALDVAVWTAPSEEVLRWAQSDPGIHIQPEFA